MLTLEKGENMIYLAGDIGGTKTHLALYKQEFDQNHLIRERKFKSQNYSDLEAIISIFLSDGNEKVDCICLGIAGPVRKGKAEATNLPWLVDADRISRELKIEKVRLINDLEANAYGLKMLRKDEFCILNQGNCKVEGNQAMVSAGTGLGEVGIYFDGKKHHPFACEGGHSDFAPRNELEDDLLFYLRKKFDHVSYERVLSGPGLYNIYRFLIDSKREEKDPKQFEMIESGDAPRMISDLGLKKKSKATIKTLEIFSSIYGAELGNVALKIFALGGLFLGGGIAPKILEVLKKEAFMEAFLDKGRFADLLHTIPIQVVLNENAALLGSIYFAQNLM